MILSVLIPSVPSRRASALALYDKITGQINFDGSVEVLMLLDNKQRSIGKKRETLVQLAQGAYVAFVDDDDSVSDRYVIEILKAARAKSDVIVFDSICTINERNGVLVTHGLEFENEQYNPAGFNRKPWHIHAWRREIAQRESFPDVSYGEDWGWCEKLLPHVRTQARAGIEPLYYYQFNSAVTEAVCAQS